MVFGFITNALRKILDKNKVRTNTSIYPEEPEPEMPAKKIYSLWDFLEFQEHTQAYHLTNIIGFEEWVDMEEIRRRIFEIFSVEYKNEKSLYPYLKTLVDIGLIETSNIGGRRKWRKREVVFEVSQSKEIEKKQKERKRVISLE